MSLWCLMASPLFYSGDMTKLDAFTLNILCNPEVIEVDQDPLGQCARVVGKPGKTFVLVKDLEDGSKAVGLCNRGEIETKVASQWSDLDLTGEHKVATCGDRKTSARSSASLRRPSLVVGWYWFESSRRDNRSRAEPASHQVIPLLGCSE